MRIRRMSSPPSPSAVPPTDPAAALSRPATPPPAVSPPSRPAEPPPRPAAPPILDPILGAWERLYRRRHRIRPIRTTGVLGLELRR
ncbi:MAG TPA: hypothetical protein VNO86_09990, partial [Candidatus Binatia bacterium]|nr:hypothetical protein [Candidatus Binatia bacterium]